MKSPGGRTGPILWAFVSLQPVTHRQISMKSPGGRTGPILKSPGGRTGPILWAFAVSLSADSVNC